MLADRFVFTLNCTDALNMAMKSLAIEVRKRGITVAVLHPGWVQTDMGGPTATLTIEQSVPSMVKVIDALRPSDNGRYLSYDGSELPW